jgi:excisionase family DNA binding protein
MSDFKRAYSISDFCQRYGVGRTTAYEEIKAGRLRAVKVGHRTLITVDDAEAWLKSLPSSNGLRPRETTSAETNLPILSRNFTGEITGKGHG